MSDLPRYRCKNCKSTKVQGTLPAWFRVNEIGLTVVDIDVEADWEYGWCEACGESFNFYEGAEKIEADEEQIAAKAGRQRRDLD